MVFDEEYILTLIKIFTLSVEKFYWFSIENISGTAVKNTFSSSKEKKVRSSIIMSFYDEGWQNKDLKRGPSACSWGRHVVLELQWKRQLVFCGEDLLFLYGIYLLLFIREKDLFFY